MKITITGRHLKVTPAIHKYIEEKFSKVEKFSLPVIDAHVTIWGEKLQHTVEIVLKTTMSLIRVSGKDQDMYAAIDLTADKLNNYVKRLKEKIKDHKHNEPRLDDLLSEESTDEEEDFDFLIKPIEIKPMDIEEARMEFDLLKYAFFMFKNKETNLVNIIYRSKTGDYIVLEPVNA